MRDHCRPPVAALALFLTLATTGCYRSHEPAVERDAASPPPPMGPPDAGPPPEEGSPERYAYELARAYCEVSAACSAPISSTRVPDLTSRIDIDLCVAHGGVGRWARRVASPFVEALRRGEGTVDPDALTACLDAVRRATCFSSSIGTGAASSAMGGLLPFGDGAPGTPAFDPACRAALRPRAAAPEGTPCDGPLDCADGLYCGRVEAAAGTCVLRCRPLPAAGTPCESGPFGDSCRLPQLVCRDGRCEPAPFVRAAEVGERCGATERDGGLVQERCVEGAFCRAGEGGPPRCAPEDVGAGERCGGERRCAPPLVCQAGPWTCRALDTTSREGAACTDGYEDGPLCDPRSGLSCGPGRLGPVCQPLPPGTLGAPCQSLDPCEPGLRCRGRECAPLLEDGDACRSHGECASRYCDAVVERCVPCAP